MRGYRLLRIMLIGIYKALSTMLITVLSLYILIQHINPVLNSVLNPVLK